MPTPTTRHSLGDQFQAILTAAQDGGEWAVAILYRWLHPAVTGYLRGRAGDVEAALAGEEAVRRIVALLPPDQADIVLLRVVAGLPVEEVAAITGRQPGTVRVLQHRALRRLADRLERPVNGV